MHNPADRIVRSGHSLIPQTSWLPNLLLTLPFLLLYWLNLYHHQSWFDEVNAWGLSAASPDLHTLFHYVHYEGHPWLWYFLLYFPSRLTHNPDQMKWVVAVFGSGIFLVLGMLSPFTRLQKILLFLSYFVAFEYTVTLRMYGMMFFLALLYARHRSRKPQAFLINIALLAIMTNVDMTAVVLSGALLIEYLYALWRSTPVEARRGWLGPLGAGLAVYLALLAFSLSTLLPAKDISWQSSGRLGANAFEARAAVIKLGNVVSGPWWPISAQFPRRFWETDAHTQHLLFLLIPFVLFAYWRSMRHNMNLLVLMFTTVAFAYLWADFVYVGRVRHWGICYVAFVVALWIQSVEGAQRGKTQKVTSGAGPGLKPLTSSGSWSAWAYALISMSALAGVVATVSSWTHPFSQSRAAAAWIRQNEPANVIITGQPDASFVSVAQQMQRPVYQMECDCFDTFKLFSRAHDNFDNSQIAFHLDQALRKLGQRQILFIFWQPLAPETQENLSRYGLAATPLAQFDGADLQLENYYLFEITRR